MAITRFKVIQGQHLLYQSNAYTQLRISEYYSLTSYRTVSKTSLSTGQFLLSTGGVPLFNALIPQIQDCEILPQETSDIILWYGATLISITLNYLGVTHKCKRWTDRHYFSKCCTTLCCTARNRKNKSTINS